MSLIFISEYNQTYRKHTSCYYCLGLTLCYFVAGVALYPRQRESEREKERDRKSNMIERDRDRICDQFVLL